VSYIRDKLMVMVENIGKIRFLVADFFKNKSESEVKSIKEEYFPPNNIPHGWISIDEHLPVFKEEDMMDGFSQYKVKFEDGAIGFTAVADPETWLDHAKRKKVTHWYNG
jgi:hypothetical protein